MGRWNLRSLKRIEQGFIAQRLAVARVALAKLVDAVDAAGEDEDPSQREPDAEVDEAGG